MKRNNGKETPAEKKARRESNRKAAEMLKGNKELSDRNGKENRRHEERLYQTERWILSTIADSEKSYQQIAEIAAAEPNYDKDILKAAFERLRESERITARQYNSDYLWKGNKDLEGLGNGNTDKKGLICAAAVKSEDTDWLLDGFLARKNISMLSGHPGIGKSTIAVDIAARISKKGIVIFVSYEDSIAATVIPRMEAAGAKLYNTYVKDRNAIINAGNIADLCKQMRVKPDLIIFDNVLDAQQFTDTNKAGEVRAGMLELSDIAEEYNAAILVLSHLNKSAQGQNALSRTLGSGQFGAVVRIAYIAIKNIKEKGRYYFLPTKANITAKQDGYEYEINAAVTTDNGKPDWKPINTSKIKWLGKTEMTADHALHDETQTGARESRKSDAADFIKRNLADGAKPAKEIIQAAQDDGISKRTLDRVKNGLVNTYQKKGDDEKNAHYWELKQ